MQEPTSPVYITGEFKTNPKSSIEIVENAVSAAYLYQDEMYPSRSRDEIYSLRSVASYPLQQVVTVYNPYSIVWIVPYNIPTDNPIISSSSVVKDNMCQNHDHRNCIAQERSGAYDIGRTFLDDAIAEMSLSSNVRSDTVLDTSVVQHTFKNEDRSGLVAVYNDENSIITRDSRTESRTESLPKLINNRCSCCNSTTTNLEFKCQICDKQINIKKVCLVCVKRNCLNVIHTHHCLVSVCRIEYTYNTIYGYCFLINGNNTSYILCDRLRKAFTRLMNCISYYKDAVNKEIVYDFNDLPKGFDIDNISDGDSMITDIIDYCKCNQYVSYQLCKVIKWKITKLRIDIVNKYMECMTHICNCGKIDKTKIITDCKDSMFYTQEFHPVNPPILQHALRVFKWKKNNKIAKSYKHVNKTDDYVITDYC
jgi:hypothetical protein